MSYQHHIYFDSNIYRHIYHGELVIENLDEIIPVFSDVHLREIKASSNDILFKSIKCIKVAHLSEQYDFITKEAQFRIVYDADLPSIYKDYINNISGYEFIDDLFIPFLARMNGAKNFEKVIHLPRVIKNYISVFNKAKAEQVSTELDEAIHTHLKKDLNLAQMRKMMTLTEDVINKIKASENPIEELFHILPFPNYLEEAKKFTSHFIPNSKDYDVIMLHGMLNSFGLWPDKKLSKEDKTNNILLDGQHIAKAIYCDAFLTSDKNLAEKAKAIYTYLNIRTSVLLISLNNQIAAHITITKKD